ncbi:hypothetical protein SynBIOSE41_01264 [Synechococcus sp. BIOS-E4-1]|nr:hypothetical protein SynBIOSE41_01264 [Synechococcus sp. BIOS-E4-1]
MDRGLIIPAHCLTGGTSDSRLEVLVVKAILDLTDAKALITAWG